MFCVPKLWCSILQRTSKSWRLRRALRIQQSKSLQGCARSIFHPDEGDCFSCQVCNKGQGTSTWWCGRHKSAHWAQYPGIMSESDHWNVRTVKLHTFRTEKESLCRNTRNRKTSKGWCTLSPYRTLGSDNISMSLKLGKIRQRLRIQTLRTATTGPKSRSQSHRVFRSPFVGDRSSPPVLSTVSFFLVVSFSCKKLVAKSGLSFHCAFTWVQGGGKLVGCT